MDNENIEQIEPIPNLRETEQRLWHWFLPAGIFTMILGIAAILLPFIATMTIQAILATVLIIAGVIQIVHAFQCRRSKGLILRIFMGIIYLLIGVMFITYPLSGALTLTLLLVLLFIVSGSFKIALALQVKPAPSWGWIMFSGIISVLLGVVIWMALPDAATWVIGLLVGIELLFSGWTMIMFSLSLRHDLKEDGTQEKS